MKIRFPIMGLIVLIVGSIIYFMPKEGMVTIPTPPTTNTVTVQQVIPAARAAMSPENTPTAAQPKQQPPFEQGCTMLFSQQCEGYSIITYACGPVGKEDIPSYNMSETISNMDFPGGYKLIIHEGVVSLLKKDVVIAWGTFRGRWLKLVVKTQGGDLVMHLLEERGVTYQTFR